jgi:hypothetical protein
MKAKLPKAPPSFDNALEALEPFSNVDRRPQVAILVALVDVSPPNNGDFRAALGPFGYEPLADAPAREAARDRAAALASLTRDVAAELNLSRVSSAEELQQLRREFMWRNHPDRCTGLSPQWSHDRVAAANMLIDRALKELGTAR